MMNLNGLSATLAALSNLEKDAEKITKDTINEVVDMMITDAKARAPRDLGRLIDSIDKEDKDNGWMIVFFVGEEHGAFQEFGTGGRVQVPAELADVAESFRGYKSGNFQDFLEAIKEWCIRKGIPEGATYPIAVTILEKGLNPQPYFYPSYLLHKDKIMSLIKAKIQRCVTLINT